MVGIEHQPKSLEELKKMRRPVRNSIKVHKEKLSAPEKIAIWISIHVGTMGFFFLIFLWTMGWLSWNTFAPDELKFDPFPAFVLWLFISNMLQILLMPLIMVGQNLQEKRAEARAEEDFEVNIKAEREIEAILMHLENQNKMVLGLIDKVDRLEKNE